LLIERVKKEIIEKIKKSEVKDDEIVVVATTSHKDQ